MPASGFFDEMRLPDGAVREHYRRYAEWMAGVSADKLVQKRAEADALFRRVGITFAVYGSEDGTERLIPFDTIPRVIPADEWTRLVAGLRQRVKALNMFLWDVYHEQKILKAGCIPADQVLNNAQYRPEMVGVDVPGEIYAHIAGVDVVRAGDGEFYVLEDNLRVPSGVSYMLEDRKMMMRLFPELFARHKVAPVEHYPDLLLENLRAVAPGGVTDPTVVVLTPGSYNSAYFEHAFLAQQMGVELVEGSDLFVKDDVVYMRTTRGPQRVDVIYRRIDDDFLDPEVFRADSMLGVPGLLRAYRAGRVTLANAIGTGVADDKSIYPYVPEMVRFYLGEEPLLNNVPTWMLRPHHRSPRKIHRPAHPVALRLPHLRGQRPGAGGLAPPHRPASVRALGAGYRHRPRRTDPGGPDQGLPGGQFLPGRWHQGHLGSGGISHAEPYRRPPLLDGPLHRARRESGADRRRHQPHVADAAKRQRPGNGLARHP